MALARAAAGQVQLGDDDDREARRAAVIAEMDARLATVGEITRPGVDVLCSGSGLLGLLLLAALSLRKPHSFVVFTLPLSLCRPVAGTKTALHKYLPT